MAKTVTHNREHTPLFGDDVLTDVALLHSFAEMVFMLLSGRKPDQRELALFTLLLNLSIDHGADTPSAKATIAGARAGMSLPHAVAHGMMEIDAVHGGAQEPLMDVLYEIADGKLSPKDVVTEHVEAKKPIPGFGHRLYKEDPRATLIITTMQKLGFDQTYIHIGEALRLELSRQFPDKSLPLNIDGAIAIALATCNWKPEWSTATFLIARSAGLCGQFLNSKE